MDNAESNSKDQIEEREPSVLDWLKSVLRGRPLSIPDSGDDVTAEPAKQQPERDIGLLTERRRSRRPLCLTSWLHRRDLVALDCELGQRAPESVREWAVRGSSIPHYPTGRWF